MGRPKKYHVVLTEEEVSDLRKEMKKKASVKQYKNDAKSYWTWTRDMGKC